MWRYRADLAGRSAEGLHFLPRFECTPVVPGRMEGSRALCLGLIFDLDVTKFQPAFPLRSAHYYPQRVREHPSSMAEI